MLNPHKNTSLIQTSGQGLALLYKLSGWNGGGDELTGTTECESPLGSGPSSSTIVSRLACKCLLANLIRRREGATAAKGAFAGREEAVVGAAAVASKQKEASCIIAIESSYELVS